MSIIHAIKFILKELSYGLHKINVEETFHKHDLPKFKLYYGMDDNSKNKGVETTASNSGTSSPNISERWY